MDLHVLGCPEHDFTISGKCMCVCDKNFVANVAQKLEIFGIRWSQFLVDEIAQKFIYKIYITWNNKVAIWIHMAQ